MAFSILSLGMFAARAFWITRRSAGLVSGLGPPDFTAMARSFPMRVKALAMRSHRLNMVAFLVSKIRPMRWVLAAGREEGEGQDAAAGVEWPPNRRPHARSVVTDCWFALGRQPGGGGQAYARHLL